MKIRIPEPRSAPTIIGHRVWAAFPIAHNAAGLRQFLTYLERQPVPQRLTPDYLAAVGEGSLSSLVCSNNVSRASKGWV